MKPLKQLLADSAAVIKNHKVVVIPVLLSIILGYMLITGFLLVIDAYEPVAEYNRLQEEFNKERSARLKQESSLTDPGYILKAVMLNSKDNPEYQKEFTEYLEKNSQHAPDYSQFLTWRNFTALIITLVIYFVMIFFLTALSYQTVASKILNQTGILLSTLKILPHFFLLGLIMAGIIIVPVLLAGGLAYFLAQIHQIAGVIVGILLVFIMFAVIIYIIYRLAFAYPALVIDKKGTINALKSTMALTKKYVSRSILVCLIAVGISFVSQNLLSGLTTTTYSRFIYGYAPQFILLFIILITIQAAVLVYQIILFTLAYKDMKS